MIIIMCRVTRVPVLRVNFEGELAVGPPIPSAADCCTIVSAASSSQGQRREGGRSCVTVINQHNYTQILPM